METYDLVVVGSGSGLLVANVAAAREESVAVVEKGPMGGTCLNRGCIPSKKLIYHADVLETIQRAGEFHIDASVDGVAFADMVHEVTAEVAEEAEHLRQGLAASPDHDLYEAEARFVDERTLAVPVDGGTEEIRGDRVVVAAGTRPRIPEIEGLGDVDHITSREALQLEQVPEHLVIVGGGYIAAEMAHFFGTFGADVTIVGRRNHLLPEADREVAEAFTRRYADRFTVLNGREATAVSQVDDTITVETEAYAETASEGRAGTVRGDTLLVATGREPNTDTLDVAQAGIETDANGFVVTDEHRRTSAENVWALGDIVGEELFKHAANDEAEVVARDIYTDQEPTVAPWMPFAVFASPEVAGVGAREAELDASGRTYAKSTARFEDTARGGAMHAEGFVKALIGEEGEILGCHIVGPDASTLIQEVVNVMTSAAGTVRDVQEAIHIHPALPEVVQRAFLGPFHVGGEHEHHHEHAHGRGREEESRPPS